MELVKRNRGPLALPVWGLLLCLLVLAGCSIPEEGFSWKLWGFETHAFIVGDEEINMRLDTSGFGRYEVTLEEGTITVFRDGETILEGWFTMDGYAELASECLADPECHVVEHVEESPGSLLLYVETEDSSEYVFCVGVEGSSSGAAFFVPDGVEEEEVLDRVHRLQFTKQD